MALFLRLFAIDKRIPFVGHGFVDDDGRKATRAEFRYCLDGATLSRSPIDIISCPLEGAQEEENEGDQGLTLIWMKPNCISHIILHIIEVWVSCHSFDDNIGEIDTTWQIGEKCQQINYYGEHGCWSHITIMKMCLFLPAHIIISLPRNGNKTI